MTTPKKKRGKLPPYVVAVKLKSGTKYRSWFPLGAAGEKKWTRLCDDPDTAYELRRTAMQVAEELPAEALTFGAAVERARQRLVDYRRPSTVRWFDVHAKVLLEEFGAGTLVAGITGKDVQRFIDRQVRARKRDAEGRPTENRLSPATLQHRRRALSLVLRGCRKLLRTNPLDDPDLTWPTVEQKDAAWFRPDQVAEIVAAIREHDHPSAAGDADLVSALFLTGLRRAEIARLRVQDIDLQGRSIWVLGKRRNERMALSLEASEVLRRMVERAGDRELLIEGGPNAVTVAVRRWATLLKRPELTPHALRHSFASALVAAGHDIATIKRYSRHVTARTLERYMHSSATDQNVLGSVTLNVKARRAPKMRKVT